MRRRFAPFRGTLTALVIVGAVWGIALWRSPQGWQPIPRHLLDSDNEYVGWGSSLEQAFRSFPRLHNFLWPLPVFT
jgi:hypothetical protein